MSTSREIRFGIELALQRLTATEEAKRLSRKKELSGQEQIELTKHQANSLESLLTPDFYKPTFPLESRDAERREMELAFPKGADLYPNDAEAANNFDRSFYKHFDNRIGDKEEHSDAERMLWLQNLADDLIKKFQTDPNYAHFTNYARNVLLFAASYGSSKACEKLIMGAKNNMKVITKNGEVKTKPIFPNIKPSEMVQLYRLQSILYRELPKDASNSDVGKRIEKSRSAPHFGEYDSFRHKYMVKAKDIDSNSRTSRLSDTQRFQLYQEANALYELVNQRLAEPEENNTDFLRQHLEAGHRDALTEILYPQLETLEKQKKDQQNKLKQQEKSIETERSEILRQKASNSQERADSKITEGDYKTREAEFNNQLQELDTRKLKLAEDKTTLKQSLAPLTAEIKQLKELIEAFELRSRYADIIRDLAPAVYEAQLAHREKLATRLQQARSNEAQLKRTKFKRKGSIISSVEFSNIDEESRGAYPKIDEKFLAEVTNATNECEQLEAELAKFDRHLQEQNPLERRIFIYLSAEIKNILTMGASDSTFRDSIAQCLQEDRGDFFISKANIALPESLRTSAEYMLLHTRYCQAHEKARARFGNTAGKHSAARNILWDVNQTDDYISYFTAQKSSSSSQERPLTSLFKNNISLAIYLMVNRAIPTVNYNAENKRQERANFFSNCARQANRLIKLCELLAPAGTTPPAPATLEGQLYDYLMVLRALLQEPIALSSLVSQDAASNPLLRQGHIQISPKLIAAAATMQASGERTFIEYDEFYQAIAEYANGESGKLFKELILRKFMTQFITATTLGQTLTAEQLTKVTHVRAVLGQKASTSSSDMSNDPSLTPSRQDKVRSMRLGEKEEDQQQQTGETIAVELFEREDEEGSDSDKDNTVTKEDGLEEKPVYDSKPSSNSVAQESVAKGNPPPPPPPKEKASTSETKQTTIVAESKPSTSSEAGVQQPVADTKPKLGFLGQINAKRQDYDGSNSIAESKPSGNSLAQESVAKGNPPPPPPPPPKPKTPTSETLQTSTVADSKPSSSTDTVQEPVAIGNPPLPPLEEKTSTIANQDRQGRPSMTNLFAQAGRKMDQDTEASSEDSNIAGNRQSARGAYLKRRDSETKSVMFGNSGAVDLILARSRAIHGSDDGRSESSDNESSDNESVASTTPGKN